MSQTNGHVRPPAGARAVLGSRSGGFTYLGLLFFVALMGAALVAIAQVWHTEVKREKEAELLFVGNQFRQAIGGYYERTPGAVKQFPKQLEDLLRDPHSPDVRRYLRKIYVDPMTGQREWGLVRAPDGGIVGVHSLSEDAPLKRAGFLAVDAAFAEATNYRGWVFAYLPPDSAGMQSVARGLSDQARRGLGAHGSANQPSAHGSSTGDP
jgi:type II secretory pathway pseudopilin PulG